MDPWHFLNFRPLPHGQGSFRPGLIRICISMPEGEIECPLGEPVAGCLQRDFQHMVSKSAPLAGTAGAVRVPFSDADKDIVTSAEVPKSGRFRITAPGRFLQVVAGRGRPLAAESNR